MQSRALAASLVLLLAGAQAAAQPAADAQAGGSRLEDVTFEASETGLVVHVATSPVPARFLCTLPSGSGREVILDLPESTLRPGRRSMPQTPFLREATVEPGSGGQGAGVRMRLALGEGVLASVEQTRDGLNLRFSHAPAGVAPDPAASAEYRIGVGDKLEIAVFGHEDLTKTVEVRGDGTINYPMIGDIPVRGKPVSQIDDDITRILGKDYLVDPQVSVDVKEYQSQWVTILGEVHTTGRYVLRRNMHLVDLLAEAGGVSKDAGSQIVVTRRQEGQPAPRTILIDREQLLDSYNPDANIALASGDIITVEEKGVFYIRGEVARPGPYFLEQGMTLLKAISLAGGLSQFANRKGIELLRSENDQMRTRLTVNLKAVEEGKKPDVALKANDIVIVPRRIF